MARVTHIAVNLSLVLALMLQPAFARVVGQDCSADYTSEFTCQGCGCCKVRQETAKCPCCGDKPEVDQEHGGCCDHGDDDEREYSSTLSIAGQNVELQQPSERDGQPTVKAAAPTLAAACNCLTRSEPHEAPVPRSPVTELRDILSLDVVVCGLMDTVEKPPLATSFDDPYSTVTPHFSQISFCVWRL